ncbi:MAG: hypothetical protein P8010_03075 [Desulfosarcinaceae bacterium]|jgi:hypothetical protein
MTLRDRIKKQYRLVLAGLAVGVAIGLAGLFWLDSRTLLLGGMAVLVATIVAGEKKIRCNACGQSVYAEIARDAAFSSGNVPSICPKCNTDWTISIDMPSNEAR